MDPLGFFYNIHLVWSTVFEVAGFFFFPVCIFGFVVKNQVLIDV